MELDENGFPKDPHRGMTWVKDDKLYIFCSNGNWWSHEKAPQQKLWDLCAEFIKKHQIDDAGQIVLHDIHLEHGMALIADICDIIGWYEE